MIAAALPMPAGNAVRLLLSPPAGAVAWRVRRHHGAAAVIPAHDHKGSFLVAETDEASLIDYEGLVNGSPYTWRAFYRDASGAWTASAPVAATPDATYEDASVQAQEFLRSRIEVGLAVEVRRGALKPPSGRIPVITAPFVSAAEPVLPTVSVHFDTGDMGQRFMGDSFGLARMPGADDWTDADGFLARQRLTISAASLNSDERIALREAIGRILLANLDVMAAAGFVTPEWSWADTEQFAGDHVLFFANAPFTCLVPAAVTSRVAPIRDADAFPQPYTMEPPHGR